MSVEDLRDGESDAAEAGYGVDFVFEGVHFWCWEVGVLVDRERGEGVCVVGSKQLESYEGFFVSEEGRSITSHVYHNIQISTGGELSHPRLSRSESFSSR